MVGTHVGLHTATCGEGGGQGMAQGYSKNGTYRGSTLRLSCWFGYRVQSQWNCNGSYIKIYITITSYYRCEITFLYSLYLIADNNVKHAHTEKNQCIDVEQFGTVIVLISRWTLPQTTVEYVGPPLS